MDVSMGKIRNFSIVNFQIWLIVCGMFTNHTSHTGHSGSSKVVLPVKFNQCRQDDGHCHLNRVDEAVCPFQIDIENSGLVMGFIDSLGTEYTAVDI